LFPYLKPLERPIAGVILALGLRSGAYQSQIFRGAILSVNPGQMEAARAIGMNGFQSFRHIVFPQALRLAVPSWSNEYAVVIKDSSFAYGVGIIEMTRVAFDVAANFPMLMSLSMVIVAILYLIFTYPVTKIFGERQSKKLKDFGMGGG
jgi:polar amino acid transport system permease protein